LPLLLISFICFSFKRSIWNPLFMLLLLISWLNISDWQLFFKWEHWFHLLLQNYSTSSM
jgi:hypothetical protein